MFFSRMMQFFCNHLFYCKHHLCCGYDIILKIIFWREFPYFQNCGLEFLCVKGFARWWKIQGFWLAFLEAECISVSVDTTINMGSLTKQTEVIIWNILLTQYNFLYIFNQSITKEQTNEQNIKYVRNYNRF